MLALDRTLLASAGEGAPTQLRALAGLIAIVGIGDAGDTEPGDDFPVDVLASFIPGDAHDGNEARRVPRRVPPRRGAGRRAPRAQRPRSNARASWPS